MYAIIRDRNQQHTVRPGEEILVDYNRSLATGSEIVFDEVCLVGGEQPMVGNPLVAGVRVVGTVVGTADGPKLIIGKYKRRKNYRRRTGFRAIYSRVRIQEIRV
jgi:large subunit ribosomal protein L21